MEVVVVRIEVVHRQEEGVTPAAVQPADGGVGDLLRGDGLVRMRAVGQRLVVLREPAREAEALPEQEVAHDGGGLIAFLLEGRGERLELRLQHGGDAGHAAAVGHEAGEHRRDGGLGPRSRRVGLLEGDALFGQSVDRGGRGGRLAQAERGDMLRADRVEDHQQHVGVLRERDR